MSTDMYDSGHIEDGIKEHIRQLFFELRNKDVGLDYVEDKLEEGLYHAYDYYMPRGSRYLIIFHDDADRSMNNIKRLKEKINQDCKEYVDSICVKIGCDKYFEEISINRTSLITSVWINSKLISLTYQPTTFEKKWKHIYTSDMSLHYRLINKNDMLVIVK